MDGLGSRLAILRSKNKMTMERTAKKIGVATSTYAGYEREYREPDMKTLVKLSDVFDVTVDYLVNGYQDTERNFNFNKYLRLNFDKFVDPYAGLKLQIFMVTRDNMSGDYIFVDDEVLYIPTSVFYPSDICVAVTNEEEEWLVRVKEHGKFYILSSSNPNVEPIILPIRDVVIRGIVVEIRRRLKGFAELDDYLEIKE